MIPTVEDKTYHFKVGGVYNGMVFLTDQETMSSWDHITGECFDGTHRGYELTYVSSPQQMTVAHVRQRYPDLQIALSRPGIRQRLFDNTLWRGLRRDTNPDGMLPPHFPRSMGEEDPRLERMEIGLGLWEDNHARFYPMAKFRESGGAMIDLFPVGSDRHVIVFIDPLTSTPMALYVPAAECAWDGDELRLLSIDGVEVGRVRNGEFDRSTDDEFDVSRPKQLFTRWYGFAFTFPQCSIYGEKI